MSVPVLIGFAGVLVAAVATGMLAGRCVRQPRIGYIAWTAATFALTLALAAESLGFARGFSPVTFRAVQLFALLLAPLWLAWGLAELFWPNEAARFGARLVCGALAVIGSVILASDPLTAQSFGKSWPLASQHYQPPSHYALDAAQVVAVIIAVTAVGLAAAGARNDRQWLGAPAGAALVALAVLITVGQRFSLSARSVYPLLGLAAAALVWLGATRLEHLPGRAGQDRQDPGGHQDPRGRQNPRGRQDRRGRQPARHDAPGTQFAADGYRGPADGGPYPPGDPADLRRPPDQGRPAPAPGTVAPEAGQATEMATEMAGAGAGFGAHARPDGPSAAPQAPPPYGRILIFTLLDDRVADFDRLAEQAAEEVRIREPDTLVYVIHLVPNAPMQRIFYEIYRDRGAFDRHERQPYMQRFVAERRSCVLATNVIELRLKYAKVAPLPNPRPAAHAAPPGPRAPVPQGQPQRPQGAQGTRGTQVLDPLPPGPDRRLPSAGRRPGGI